MELRAVRMGQKGGDELQGVSVVKIYARVMAAVLACIGAVGMTGAQAQALPAPKEFYFDQDASTTRPVVAIAGTGDALVERLANTVQRNSYAGSGTSEACAQLAAIAMTDGHQELGKQLYQEALQGLSGSAQRRQMAWNYGWSLLRIGDPAGALNQWSGLINGHPAAPDWIPPTLALVLWRLQRKDEAVKWYAAAVRTWPDKWGGGADFAALLPNWRAAERATLADVHAAWQAAPPAWP